MVDKATLDRLGVSRRRWNAMGDEERVNLLVARVERDAVKREQVLEMPAEPTEPETVLFFQKTFGRLENTTYQYVAHLVADKGWKVSNRNGIQAGGGRGMGPSSSPRAYYTWAEVWDFICRREPEVPTVWWASEWRVLE
jgi:hypothetical protein